ncbi:YceD family protein [Paenisporosarcina cavernae]|uniref:Metal-binding protein n=1 Tax=Paenisporosarcina cavernae TaxID=2320858 RepID=A0A385YRC6_9BACL|nr:YceD family protein [Paenisporosarcina cavernae]AYC29146.1 hypothetical protein D3873_04350 [Paenisporosarcina cavernae]
MKWSIHQLAKYRQSAMPVDEVVQMDNVMKRNPDIREISPVHVKGHCTVRAAQLTCHFRLTGKMILPCARTWEDVEYPFDITLNEIFSWSDQPVDETSEIHQVEGEVIDIDPIIEESILLEVPMQVFKEGTSENAIAGGKDWSYMVDEDLAKEDEDDTKKLDPRLAELAKYFDQTDE